MEIYNHTTALHYQAYRPPLHEPILAEILDGLFFDKAIDVGCGTGASTRALLPYCKQLWGFDPSTAMILQAPKQPQINYVDQWPKISDIDLLCFFGALHYIEARTLDTYLQILAPKGSVVCCDFSVILSPVFEKLQMRIPKSTYDHKKNLSAINYIAKKITTAEKSLTLTIQIDQLSHLLLSDSNHLSVFQKQYQKDDPLESLANALTAIYRSDPISLEVDAFWTYYSNSD